MRYFTSITQMIGNTPLLQLHSVVGSTQALVLAKMESANPGGSVKDRVGIRMLEAAERDGKIGPGALLIEPTSGNTGIGLMLAAREKGYRCLFVMTDKASVERVRYLKALGADILIVSSAAKPSSPDYYYNTAVRLAGEIAGAYMLNQYDNPGNPEAHYYGTAPEIWEQTDGRITHFVAGMGTGGTISGCGRFFKEKNSDIKVIGADPFGSSLKEYKDTGRLVEALPYLVEGVGQERIPGNLDFGCVDEVINVSDRDSFMMARRLAREEGIFCGGSSGMNVAAVGHMAPTLKPTDVVVVIIADTGERYLTKHHSDEWLQEKGFLEATRISVQMVLDMKNSKRGGLPSLVCAHPEMSVREALEVMNEQGFSQLPVMRGNDSLGSLRDNRVMAMVLDNRELLESPVRDLMEPSFPVIPHTTDVSHAIRYLRDARAVLVSEYGIVDGILTRHDLVEYT